MVLLNDLIDLAALEAHQVPFQQRAFVRARGGCQLGTADRPLAAQKGLSLELVPAPGLPAQWHLGDAERIQQVLLNLLDNAVKFSHSGAIRLELNAQEAGERTRWSLRVIDQGIGIAAADQPRLFTIFEQMDGSATRSLKAQGWGWHFASAW